MFGKRDKKSKKEKQDESLPTIEVKLKKKEKKDKSFSDESSEVSSPTIEVKPKKVSSSASNVDKQGPEHSPLDKFKQLTDEELNTINLQTKMNVLIELAEKVQQDSSLQDLLWNILESTKKNPDLWRVGANAATLLNYARISFSGRDLSHAHLGGNIIRAYRYDTNHALFG